jgi:hypothetical protein
VRDLTGPPVCMSMPISFSPSIRESCATNDAPPGQLGVRSVWPFEAPAPLPALERPLSCPDGSLVINAPCCPAHHFSTP